MAATSTLTIRTDSVLKQQASELFGTDVDTGMQEPNDIIIEAEDIEL